jgi:hypothetical protein
MGSHIHLYLEHTLLDGLFGKKSFLLVDPLQGADGKSIGSIVPKFAPTVLEACKEAQHLGLAMERELRNLFKDAEAHNVSVRFSIKSAYEVFVNSLRASELEGYIGDMLEDGKISFSEESIEDELFFGKEADNNIRLKAFHESLKNRDEENASKTAVIFNVRKGVDEKEIRYALQGGQLARGLSVRVRGYGSFAEAVRRSDFEHPGTVHRREDPRHGQGLDQGPGRHAGHRCGSSHGTSSVEDDQGSRGYLQGIGVGANCSQGSVYSDFGESQNQPGGCWSAAVIDVFVY